MDLQAFLYAVLVVSVAWLLLDLFAESLGDRRSYVALALVIELACVAVYA